ncbi:WecB/TagA/CpsF family glycosyltransferase [Microbacterium paludicola]|uniref:WecB/TagA/CpsF family glycosyltransferase n=1 Tax=Microbacterium paludicola TaxID=300019 RepID=UPI0011AA22E9|nr:WecB/TagA/CpsF family glycosyltransferase [Microbacterium paludicola]
MTLIDRASGFLPGSLVSGIPTIDIDGTPVHVIDDEDARGIIADAAEHVSTKPLAVVSVNLDHVHHFGRSQLAARHIDPDPVGEELEWLNLVDGAPIAKQVRRVSGVPCPKLSGSDLIVPVLGDADQHRLSVAVIGGMPEVTATLAGRFESDWPHLRFAGHWTPGRDELASPEASARIAAEMREAGVDIVLVCLGKPRQEKWIAEYGAATGAGVLLAFGAVVDFLAGRVSRAPSWVSDAGMEWAWRLMLEPKRLARRYLIEGPPAYLAVRRSAA